MRFAVDVSLRAMSVPRALARWAVLWVETRFRLSFRAIVWWVLMAPLRVTPAVLIERNGCSMSRNAFATTLVLGCSIGASTMNGGFRTFLDGWRIFGRLLARNGPVLHQWPPLVSKCTFYRQSLRRRSLTNMKKTDYHASAMAMRARLPREHDYHATPTTVRARLLLRSRRRC